MEQISPKYNFRRRDYVKIKNWYDFAKTNFVPQDLTDQKENKKDKQQEWHYRIMFDTLELTQHFLNANMKNLFQLRQLVFINSLYHREKDCIVSSGKEITVGCQFDVANLSIKCSEQLVFFFYLNTPTPKDYEFCLQIQMLNNEGQILRFGYSKFPLLQRKDSPKKSSFLVFSNVLMDKKQREEIQNISQIRQKQEELALNMFVAKVEFDLDTEQIKQVRRYLPAFKIINKNSKLPPTNFNLKKKKEQIVVDGSYKVTMQDLMIQVHNSEFLKAQLQHSNPFTYSHKELIELRVKEYRVIIDHHNGWKSLDNNKLQLILQLVVEKGQKIYISSKQLPKVQINYYESDCMILFAALVCKVEFKLKGMVEQLREQEFLIGWLPLPLDLSLKQNNIQLLMVYDLQFPLKINHIAHVPVTLSLTFLYPNFQKYKNKNEDKKMYRQSLLDQTNILNSTRYMKLQSRRNVTETFSSESNIHQSVEVYLQHAKETVRMNELQFRQSSYVTVSGRSDGAQQFPIHHSRLPMEHTVGKVLKVKLQIDTFIPESDSPFDYYLPKHMQASIYFLRESHQFPINITERDAKFNIPLQISNQKIKIYFKRLIDTVQEFQAIMSSRFIVTLYEQNNYKLYGKGMSTTHEILGATQSDKIAYINVKRWESGVQKLCGKLLVLVNLEVQKLRQGNNKVQQLQIQNVMNKLTTEQRMRLRIGNFKGDFHSKIETINMIKKKQHNDYIQKVVASEQKCDGELYYELGVDTYSLLTFSNEDRSQNNVFTFHIGCHYAEIVTNEQQFRSVIERHNFYHANFQKMSYYLKEPSYLSYYETKLNFNQEIGILIKLNVFELSQKEQPLSRIDLVIKRNTIEVRKILVKCRYKQPLLWDIFYHSDLQHHSEGKDSFEVSVDLDEELTEKYRDIQVMTKHIKVSTKQKKFIVSRSVKSMKVVLFVHDKAQNRKGVILYHIHFFQGRRLSVLAGKPYRVNIQLEAIQQAQIMRCNDCQVRVNSTLKFRNQVYNENQDLQIKVLRPCKNKNIIVVCYDLSGKQLSQYLFKIESRIEFISNRVEIILDQTSTYALTLMNPYACACYFDIECSTKAVNLEQTQLRLQSYGQKLVQFKVRTTRQKQIYFYLLDRRGNICQIIEIVCQVLSSDFNKQE